MKSKIYALLTSFIGLAVAACGQAKFVAVNVPASFIGGEVVQNIAYGTHSENKMDIYLPANKADGTPSVVFFHGGRWTDGNKDQYKFVGKTMAQIGYITIVPSTRSYPEVKFPLFIEDAALAVKKAHDLLPSYGGNPDNMFLMGHSSGAHVAAMVATDDKYIQAAGGRIQDIAGFAGLAGPYDFVPEAQDIKNIFSTTQDNYGRMQVSTFIDGTEAPMLLLHGSNDQQVKIANLEKLERKINAEGGAVSTKIYPDLDHVDLIRDFTWLDVSGVDIPRDVDTFFKANIR